MNLLLKLLLAFLMPLLVLMHMFFPDVLGNMNPRLVALFFFVFVIFLIVQVILRTRKALETFNEIGESGEYKQYDLLYWLKGDITVYRKNKRSRKPLIKENHDKSEAD